MKYLALVVLLFPIVTFAGPERKIEAPKPKVMDREFFAAMTVLAAAKTADGITSIRMLNRGCHETNPIFGERYPSSGRIAGTNAAYLAGEVALAYTLKRLGQNHRWTKHLWLIEPAYQVGGHIAAAADNEALVCQ
jgi:hypothetical protein